MSAKASGGRRTQAERRAATRSALLEATAACLTEHGYVRMTTSQIADAAGVTRGAVAHHFASKSELVLATMQHIGDRVRDDFLAAAVAGGPLDLGALDEERIGELLDVVWSLYRSPANVALAELWLVARTDPDLRDTLQPMAREFSEGLVHSVADVLASSPAEVPGLLQLSRTTLAVMRGLGLMSFVSVDVDREWRGARQHLKTLWVDLLSG